MQCSVCFNYSKDYGCIFGIIPDPEIRCIAYEGNESINKTNCLWIKNLEVCPNNFKCTQCEFK